MALYKGETLLAGSGAGFNPENAGTTGQVLTKTETGYAYCDLPGGIKYGCVDILIVGGGGAAGSRKKNCNVAVGGGGAGGVINRTGYLINSTTDLSIPVTVGAGGAWHECILSCNGGDSSFGSLVAKGGGVGAGYLACNGTRHSAGNGGSGGGGNGGYYDCGTGTPGQGYNGGLGAPDAGGGGGGAGSVGCPGSCNWTTITGGVYCQITIGGSLFVVANGGSGVWRCCVGATGGASNCGGGGNASRCGASVSSGAGGIVVVAYKTDGSCGILPTSTGGRKYTNGDYTIHQFTDYCDTFTPIFK